MTEAEQTLLAKECPTEFNEPYSGREYDRHYSAMPANPYINEQVKAREAVIKAELGKLFEHPPEEMNIPESFRQLLIDDYHINVERRRMINFENFAKWRQDHPRLHDALEASVQRVENGYTEVGDILDVALNTSLSGLEVGRITHPYGQRIEQVTPMRLNVAAAINERGGTLESISKPYKRIKIVPKIERLGKEGEQEITGFIVRYKHDLGFIPKAEGEVLRVVERQVAAYRADEASGFPQDIIAAMQELAEKEQRKTKKPFYWDNVPSDRLETLLTDSRCRGFIEKSVQTDSLDSFIIPESTTIFCYPEKVPDNYLAARAQQKLANTALRQPDVDNGIALFYSSSQKER